MKRIDFKPLSLAGRFARKEDGAAMVEFVFVLPLFLLMLLAIIDFGRYSADFVMTQKALERGARIAAVRPAICVGVAETHEPTASTTAKFGTPCSTGGICKAPAATPTCALSTVHPTGAEIWAIIEDVLPSTVGAADLTVSYAFNENLGFLGGPYVPEVTIELTDAQFRFVTPLGQLAMLAARTNDAGGVPSGLVTFPNMSVTFTGEDLALGTNG